MSTLYQSAINISEGRNIPWLDDLKRSLTQDHRSILWNFSSDPDHNRSVITLGGTLTEIILALKSIYLHAQDLSFADHHGVHPRHGLVDVVPFTPLNKNITSVPWEPLQHRILSLTQEFEIAGYTYDLAHPDRRSLPQTRRAIQERQSSCFGIEHPDDRLGATCFSLRPPLVAFNLLVDTQDPSIATALAHNMREAHSGLTGVRALAFFLESKQLYQISLNLTQPDKVTPLMAKQYLEKLAKEHHVNVLQSELIGLARARYLWDCVQHQLNLDPANHERQILESIGWTSYQNNINDEFSSI